MSDNQGSFPFQKRNIMSQPPRRNDEALMGENSIRNEEGFMGFSLHSEENLAMGGRQVGGRKATVMESLYGEDSLGEKGESCTTKSTGKGETLIIIMGLLMPITCWGRRV
jgi:hypothetical protein